MKKIYLAGPITGRSFAESESWRDEFKSLVTDCKGIECYSPLRGKQYLINEVSIADSYQDHILSTAAAILARDYHDVHTAAALVANFTGATRVSIGTVVEIAWAHGRRIPIIIIGDKNGVHSHSFLRSMANWWVDDVAQAATVIRAIFTP